MNNIQVSQTFPYFMTKLYQNMYTGRMNKIIVMNISFLSRMLYGMVKPVLSERTKQKMFFIGANLITGLPGEFNPAI